MAHLRVEEASTKPDTFRPKAERFQHATIMGVSAAV